MYHQHIVATQISVTTPHTNLSQLEMDAAQLNLGSSLWYIIVWNYFLFTSRTDKSCCNVQVNSGSEMAQYYKILGKFPTNLKVHLKKCHSRVFQKLLVKEKEAKLLTISRPLSQWKLSMIEHDIYHPGH